MARLKVPHIKQSKETTCGAAVLCMIYLYYGLKNQTEDKIWARLKEPRKLNPTEEFIQTINIAKDAKKNNLHYMIGQAVWNNPKKAFALLREYLRIGVPVVVCQKFRSDQLIGHFRIVVGMENGKIFLNDPELEEPESVMTKKEFILMWKKCSDEVIGGQFLVILTNEQVGKLKGLPLYYFQADIKDYQVSNLNFES